jgi:hypothetical protein
VAGGTCRTRTAERPGRAQALRHAVLCRAHVHAAESARVGYSTGALHARAAADVDGAVRTYVKYRVVVLIRAQSGARENQY